MKTRVVVREYNDGRKEYECQYASDNTIMVLIFMCFTIVLIPVAIIGLIKGVWFTMEKKGQILVGVYRGRNRQEFIPAVFDSWDEAKRFINECKSEKINKKAEEYRKQVKKEFYVKCP